MISTPSPRPFPTWPQVRDHLRTTFSELSEEDLVLIEGREENLLDTIIQKTGRTREVVIGAFRACGMFSAR